MPSSAPYRTNHNFRRDQVLPDNTARRDYGKAHMSAVVIYLLAQNQWSHPILEELAAWALNEDGALHASQVSHIRNGRMRMLGVKTIDAFGAINVATWAYHHDRVLLKQLGTATLTARIEELLMDAKAILDPATELPLDAGGWMNLYLGYTTIESVAGSAATAEAAARSIGQYIEKAVKESGKDFMEAKVLFGNAMSDNEKARKMIAVAASIETYSPEDLTTDMEAICQALQALDGRVRDPEMIIAALS